MKSYCDAVATVEGLVTDAGEAVGQAGQRDGGATLEGGHTDAGDTVG